MRREIDTKDSFQEVGPLVKNPPKSIWDKLFLRNCKGSILYSNFQKTPYENFLYDSNPTKVPSFFLYSKEGLSLVNLL
jgi:hypothetical protein